MADIMDVAKAVRDVVAAALQAAGMLQPSATWKGTRVYTAWPTAALDADLQNGIVNVSIWPLGTTRNLGPYLDGWQEDDRPAPSMSVTVGEDSVTFAGNATVPNMVAAVTVGEHVAATRAVVVGDTPESLAAALAASLAPSWPGASASDATITLPGAYRLAARIVVGGTEHLEVRRVVQNLVVTVWAPSAALRDQVARVVDDALQDHRRLSLPDGTKAFLSYVGTGFDEEARQAPLHRRDLTWSCEYISIRRRSADPVVVPDIGIGPDDAPIRRVIISGGMP